MPFVNSDRRDIANLFCIYSYILDIILASLSIELLVFDMPYLMLQCDYRIQSDMMLYKFLDICNNQDKLSDFLIERKVIHGSVKCLKCGSDMKVDRQN